MSRLTYMYIHVHVYTRTYNVHEKTNEPQLLSYMYMYSVHAQIANGLNG